jgi:hypothetical protein
VESRSRDQLDVLVVQEPSGPFAAGFSGESTANKSNSNHENTKARKHGNTKTTNKS